MQLCRAQTIRGHGRPKVALSHVRNIRSIPAPLRSSIDGAASMGVAENSRCPSAHDRCGCVRKLHLFQRAYLTRASSETASDFIQSTDGHRTRRKIQGSDFGALNATLTERHLAQTAEHQRVKNGGSRLDRPLSLRGLGGISINRPVRHIKRFRISPSTALGLLLKHKEPHRRRLVWKRMYERGELLGLALPTMVLRYIHSIENPSQTKANAVTGAVNAEVNHRLAAMGYSADDLHTWAWIVLAPNPDVRARRYLASSTPTHKMPLFLLLLVLKETNIHPNTFRQLLLHCWDRLRESTGDRPGPPGDESPIPLAQSQAMETSHVRPFEINTFEVFFYRLLRLARALWPGTMVTLAHMMTTYFDLCMRRIAVTEDIALTRSSHAKINKMFNVALGRLSLPSAVRPLASMRHNWSAQQVLLSVANSYERPLIINKSSYRAVSRVLAAVSKSTKEKEYARLMQRTWPPWRREKDGMDALRPAEDDLSRVVQTMRRMNEAGYAEGRADDIIKTIGGRNPDGTPTVRTRYLMKEGRGMLRSPPNQADSHAESLHWAARIRATRDRQEAWSTFLNYGNSKPSMEMYLAMFEKINASYKLSGSSADNVPPGDGKEVIAVADDNMSESERQRLTSPSLQQLYFQMLHNGIKPSGNCLIFLISTAMNFRRCAGYLKSSDLNQEAVQMLLGAKTPDKGVRKIPRAVLAAFIKITCRLVMPLQDGRKRVRSEVNRMAVKLYYPTVYPNPLLHSLELLKAYDHPYPPAWYALFSALSKRQIIIDKSLNAPANDVLSWRVLRASIRDAEKAGLRLDPAGFCIICRGFEKLISAAQPTQGLEGLVSEGAKSLKSIWKGFVHEVERDFEREKSFHLPKLLHSIEGTHLHAYVRVLGITRDVRGISEVIQWMSANQIEIAQAALASRNGRTMLRKVLVAVRAILEVGPHVEDADTLDADGTIPALDSQHVQDISTDQIPATTLSSDAAAQKLTDEEFEVQMARLREEVDALAGWGGWPTDDEVETYRSLGLEST